MEAAATDKTSRQSRFLPIISGPILHATVAINAAVCIVGLVISFLRAYRPPPAYPSGHYLAVWVLMLAIALTALSYVHKARLTVAFIVYTSAGGVIILIPHVIAGNYSVLWILTWVWPLFITYYRHAKHQEADYHSLEGALEPKPRARKALNCCFAVLIHTCRLLVAVVTGLLSYQAVMCAMAAQYTSPGPLVLVNPSNPFGINVFCKDGLNQTLPTFLLHHGGGSASPSMYGLQNELVLRGRKACVVDRSGFGYSEFPFTWPRGSDIEVEEIAQALRGANITEPLIVLGHSAGGQIALHQATHNSTYQQVVGVGLLDSVPNDYLRTFEKYVDPEFWTEERINATYAMQASMMDIYRVIWPLGILSMMTGGGKYVPEDKKAENKATYVVEKTWVMQYHLLNTDSIGLYDTYPSKLPGNPDMLVIRALGTCEQKGLTGEACEKDTIMYYRSIEVANEQADMVTPAGSVVICEYPCGHGFVWETPEYVADIVMETFANTISSSKGRLLP